MESNDARVFYNSDFGFIIAYETRIIDNGLDAIMDDVTVLQPNALVASLGNAIFDSLRNEQAKKHHRVLILLDIF